jgi:hypothetical protein
VLKVSFNHFAVAQINTIFHSKSKGFMLFSYTSKKEKEANLGLLFNNGK